MADEKDNEQSQLGTPVDGRLLLQMQIDRLTQGLNKRSNPRFDPSLMKMASGFLKPTKTGGFGESLGYAGEEYATESEKQRERDDAEQKLQLELFQKQYELQQEQAGQDFLDKFMSGKLAGTPSSGVATDGTSALPSGNAMDLAASGKMAVTDDIILAAKRARVPKSTIDFLEKLLENQRKSTETEQKEYANVPTPIPYVNEVVPHTIAQERQINNLKQKAAAMQANGATEDDIRNMFYDYYENGGGKGLVDVTKIKGGARQIETPMQRTTRMELEKEQGKSNIEINKEDIKKIESARDNSVQMMNNGKAVLDVVTNPKTAATFGILSKPGYLSALGELIKEPLRVGDISIGVPSVEVVARKAFKTQEEIDAATAIGSNLAQLELAFSQSFKGQGQVSDNERLIVRAVGPSISDSPKVAALKAESIIARAEYDRAIAKEYQKYQSQNKNASFREFKGTESYDNIVQGYDGKLSNIMSKYGLKAPAAPGAQPSPAVKPKGRLESFIKSQPLDTEETT